MPFGGDDKIICSAQQLIQFSSEWLTQLKAVGVVTKGLFIGSNNFSSIYKTIFQISKLLLKKLPNWLFLS